MRGKMKRYIWGIIKDAFAFAFFVIGGAWTALEIIEVIPFKQEIIDAVEGASFVILLIVGIAGWIGKLIYSFCQMFFQTYPKGDKTIRIRIGNILDRTNGNIIVGVNEQLITSPGELGPSSIHMQLTRHPGWRSYLEEIFEEQKEKVARGDAENCFFQKFLGDQHIIFLPMSNLHDQQVVTTTTNMVSDRLEKLFSNQGQLRIKNQTVYCPLLGTGEAGIHLSKEETIKMIVRIFIRCCENMTSDSADKIKHLEIVVYWKDIGEINWMSLNQELKFIICNCDKCAR